MIFLSAGQKKFTRFALIVLGLGVVVLLDSCATAQGTGRTVAAESSTSAAQPAKTSAAAGQPTVQSLEARITLLEKTLATERAASRSAASRSAKTIASLEKQAAEIRRVLNAAAYRMHTLPENLLSAGRNAVGRNAVGRNAAGTGAYGAPSPASDSLMTTEQTTSGASELVDIRANATLGSSLFLAIRETDGKLPRLALTVEYRYPDRDPPFLTKSIVLTGGRTQLPLPLSAFTPDWYRSGPFKIESYTTTDDALIQHVLSAVLDAGSPPTLRFTGLTSTAVRLITHEETAAISNVLYTYRQLGGTGFGG